MGGGGCSILGFNLEVGMFKGEMGGKGRGVVHEILKVIVWK